MTEVVSASCRRRFSSEADSEVLQSNTPFCADKLRETGERLISLREYAIQLSPVGTTESTPSFKNATLFRWTEVQLPLLKQGAST
jgi:hypothetical protein